MLPPNFSPLAAARESPARQRRVGEGRIYASPVRACSEQAQRTEAGSLPPIPLLCAFGWLLLATPFLCASDCIPIHEANHHVGETQCVTGQVHRVRIGTKGVHFVDFCEDQAACPFTVVVFPYNLKDVGDIRRLEGRVIEINGAVKMYDGRAEIILNRISQIRGGAAMIPRLPKNYDVEKQGHYSAGRLYPTKKPKKTKATPSSTATYGNDVEGQDPQ